MDATKPTYADAMSPVAKYRPIVLVADDDDLVRLFLRAALESKGWRVMEARSGEEAAQLASSERIGAVLIDGHMPGWSLDESLDALRALAATRDFGVIVVSGAPVELGQNAAFVREVLRKPVQFDRLEAAVQSAVASRDGTPAART